MPRKQIIVALLTTVIFFSTIVFADTSASDDKATMIQEALSLAKVKDQFLQIQKVYPKAQFYEQIVAAFNENFDEDKLKKVIEWQQSPLGQKVNSLNKLYSGIPNPLDLDALSLLLGNRMELLKQIRVLQGDIALETMKVILKESFETINGLLPQDQQMDYEQREKAIESRIRKWEESNSALQLNSMAFLYKSFSDDELSQFIEYLKSDEFQWFNDCLLNRYLRTLAPAVKEWAIGHDLEGEVGKELKEEFFLPDSQAWYVPYYYRSKESSRIIPMLNATLANRKILANPSLKSQFFHFFATLIHGQEGLEKQVEQLKNYYVGVQHDFIQAIIQDASEYKPARLDSIEGINKAWAEYYATGDESIIKNILNQLSQSENESNQEFLIEVQVSIIKNALKDLRIEGVIRNLSAHVDNRSREKIDKLVAMRDSFGDIASDLNFRGYNYENNDQYTQAIRDYKLALTYAPDYAQALVNLSQTLYDDRDQEKMLLYIPAALYLDPKSDGVNQLGIYYYHKNIFSTAIKYFKAAVDLDPTWPPFIHNLALTYLKAGDNPNAIKYYTQYLINAPNGQFSDEAYHYLASKGTPFKENASDPFVMLKEKRYDDLEKYLAALLKTRQKDKEGNSLLYNAYGDIISPVGADNISGQILIYLEDWVSQRPLSHFANISLGRFYVYYAWQARGNGWDKTVTEEGWKLFKERLLKAQEYLEKAYALDPTDPFASSRMVGGVVMGLQLDKDEMEKQFQRAVKADPGEYQVYAAKLKYLMPKWYGSEEEMFDFARESAQNALPHSLVAQVLLDAHWEMFWKGWYKKDYSYFKKPGVWEEVQKTYERLLTDFPDSIERRNWYARAAFLAGDFVTAKKQFAIIQNNWDAGCWGNLEYFQKVKNEVLSSSH